MPSGKLCKNDVLARVYKLKTGLYDGEHSDKSAEWHDGAHDAYNKILDLLNEYTF